MHIGKVKFNIPQEKTVCIYSDGTEVWEDELLDFREETIFVIVTEG